MEQDGILIVIALLAVAQVWSCWQLYRVRTKIDSSAKDCDQIHRLCREMLLRTEPTKKLYPNLERLAQEEAKPLSENILKPASMASLRAMAESSMTAEQARERRVNEFNG